MKRTILTVAGFCGLWLCHQSSARAQVGFGAGVQPVIDAASILQEAHDEANEIAELIEQYKMAVNEWDALAHGNTVLSVASGLLGQGVQNPGSAAGQIPGLAFGSSLGSAADQFLNQNHYYTPQGTDFEAQEMQRQETATANIQGEALMGMQTADQRIALLQQLATDIENQVDVTGVTAGASHINSEQNFLANEQAKVQRLELMAQMQDRVDQQRAEQNGRQDAESWHALAASEAFGQ